jgi:hypothetical protein
MKYKIIKPDEFLQKPDEFLQISGRLVIIDGYYSLNFKIWRNEKSNKYFIYVDANEQVVVDCLVSNNICIINKRTRTEFELIPTPQILLELI